MRAVLRIGGTHEVFPWVKFKASNSTGRLQKKSHIKECELYLWVTDSH